MTILEADTLAALPDFRRRVNWFITNQPQYAATIGHLMTSDHPLDEPLLLSIVSPERLRRIMATAADPDEFLSPYGLRGLSRYHREHPFVMGEGDDIARVDYEPGESLADLYGGNSNWRGPVWMPINALAVEALHRYGEHMATSFTIPYPNDGSGSTMSLTEVADDLRERLISIFLDGPDGRRPVMGHYEKMQTDPAWHDLILFHEYFHGDSGMGLGASHQTGWTGLVIELIVRRHTRDQEPGVGSEVQPTVVPIAAPMP
jgi:hypothetical protein